MALNLSTRGQVSKYESALFLVFSFFTLFIASDISPDANPLSHTRILLGVESNFLSANRTTVLYMDGLVIGSSALNIPKGCHCVYITHTLFVLYVWKGDEAVTYCG